MHIFYTLFLLLLCHVGEVYAIELKPMELQLIERQSIERQPAKAYSTLINNTGAVVGNVHYTEASGGVLIEIKAHSLPPGKHGMHFHKVGTCADHTHFKMAKGHIMPTGKPHGYLHPMGPHEGNLPNLIVHADGSAHVELYTTLVSLQKVSGKNSKPPLLDEDGSTLMVHAHTDDHKTQPIGGAGRRIACGVVKPYKK